MDLLIAFTGSLRRNPSTPIVGPYLYGMNINCYGCVSLQRLPNARYALTPILEISFSGFFRNANNS
ncbi:MAG: hypothetical protein NC346_00900 [Prevotella sp.]|nr:hypothetical protein [Prevotella sp.]